MARPLLACLLVSACSVPNPWFGTPHVASDASTSDATTSAGETPPDDPQSTSDPHPTTGTSAASATSSDATSSDLTTADPPHDLPQSSSSSADDSTSSSTSSTSSTSGSTSGDASTGDGESSSTAPIESDSDTENVGPPPCDPDDDNLLACYDFENPANMPSVLIDGSSYNHDGTATGALYPPGLEGQGLKISANTKTEVADVATLDPQSLSMSAWIKITNLPPPGGAAIIEKSGQYSLKILENPMGLACTVNASTITHGFGFPQDEWTHVACVYGDGQFKLYMNGQAVKTGVHGNNIAVGFNPLHVGCGGPACQFRLIGAILDRVRLWKVALPQNIVCVEANAC